MLQDRPAVRLPIGAASRKSLAHRLLPLLALSTICLPILALAQGPADSCTKCHADLVRGFADSPHGKAANAVTCESCHGDGKAHADSKGDATMILSPAKASAKDTDARCLTCHAAQHPNFAHSAHATAGIGCVSCHSVHAAKEGKQLKAPQPALCYQCHSGVESEFAAPVHHKVDAGPVKCTACHDPHAIFQTQLQAAIAQQVSACLKCHTELAGPWVYEHKAVKQAGCTACHTPHGGAYPKLLTFEKVNTICLQCHLPSATLDDPQVNAAHTPASTRPCTDCHVSIHGSNHENRFVNP